MTISLFLSFSSYLYLPSSADCYVMRKTLPHSIGQLLVLDLRAEEVWVCGLVAHGGGKCAEDGVQKLKDLVLVDAVPAVSWRLAQWPLHGHQQRSDVDKTANLAEYCPCAVTLTQHC